MENQGDKVSLKKKVTLRQKQSEATLSPIHTNPKPKPKKWLWLIPAVVVIAGVVLAVANIGGKDKTIQVAETIAPTLSNVPSVVPDETVTAEESITDPSADKDNSSTAEAAANVAKPSSTSIAEKAPDSKANAAATSSTPVVPADKPSASDDSPKNSAPNSTSSVASLSSSLDENALRVVRGEFGNGQERKNALGDRYTEIQSRVNEMYREGRFN